MTASSSTTKTMMSRQREAAASGEGKRGDEVNAVRPDTADSYGPINQARWTQKMRTDRRATVGLSSYYF